MTSGAAAAAAAVAVATVPAAHQVPVVQACPPQSSLSLHRPGRCRL